MSLERRRGLPHCRFVQGSRRAGRTSSARKSNENVEVSHVSRNLIDSWAGFGRGHRETLSNRCARLALEARLADAGGDLRELLIGTVTVPDFLVRR